MLWQQLAIIALTSLVINDGMGRFILIAIGLWWVSYYAVL